jgi:nucleoside-diphosphate-sugar epimerase
VSEVPTFQAIDTEDQLIDQMTTPTRQVEAAVRDLDGDILILGIAGKMGPTLGELLVRAGARRVIGVSRFSNPDSRKDLEDRGIETIKADLLDEQSLADLPDAPFVYQMAGHKFGSTGNEALTWAMNTLLPANVVSRYRDSKIVYVSSGNVYKFASTDSSGATETDPVEPIGEYAQSRLGGERVAAHQASRFNTGLAIIRLFYATELRYGIVLDIGQKVLAREPIDLTMGYVNQLWQGDANGYLAQSFPLCESPARTINMTGRDVVPVRSIAEALGKALSVEPIFTGESAPTALLGDAAPMLGLLGEPHVGIDQIIAWVAGWLAVGGETLGKPTKFESRTGKF